MSLRTLRIVGMAGALVGVIVMAAPASAQTRITVQIGSGYGPAYYPPPPVVYAPQVVAPAPYRVGYVWQPGYYARVGNSRHRRWVPGRYVRAPFWRGQGYYNQGWRGNNRGGYYGPANRAYGGANNGYNRGYGQGFSGPGPNAGFGSRR
jgi:hypothetical protein